MSTLSISQLKNKIKRQIIRFHHNKNKLVSKKSHMISERDPSKPLLSLRTTNQYVDEHNDINYQFDTFSAVLTSISEHNESQIQTQTQTQIQPQIIDTQELFAETYSILSDNLLNLEAQKIVLENSLKNNINYIEQEPRRRKKFWIFGPRANSKRGNENENENENENSPSLIQQTTAKSNNTLIISLSSQEQIKNVHDQSSYISFPVENQLVHKDLMLTSEELKISSFSRIKNMNSSFNASQPSLLKDQKCLCSVCERRINRHKQPWKIVMNDISLQAALASTGSKQQMPLQLSQDTIIDYRSLKNEPRIMNSLVNPELEWIKFSPVPDYLSRLSIENDENITFDQDFPDNHNKIPRKSLSKPFTHETTLVLEQDLYKEDDKSTVYGGVFQNYYYSDESLHKDMHYEHEQEQEKDDQTLPLSLRSTNRLKRLI